MIAKFFLSEKYFTYLLTYLLFSPRETNINILFMSLANNHTHHKYPKRSVCTGFRQLLLVISGNVELYIGP